MVFQLAITVIDSDSLSNFLGNAGTFAQKWSDVSWLESGHVRSRLKNFKPLFNTPRIGTSLGAQFIKSSLIRTNYTIAWSLAAVNSKLLTCEKPSMIISKQFPRVETEIHFSGNQKIKSYVVNVLYCNYQCATSRKSLLSCIGGEINAFSCSTIVQSSNLSVPWPYLYDMRYSMIWDFLMKAQSRNPRKKGFGTLMPKLSKPLQSLWNILLKGSTTEAFRPNWHWRYRSQQAWKRVNRRLKLICDDLQWVMMTVVES